MKVYLFDHAGGFDWFYSSNAAVMELLTYADDGWLVEGDNLKVVDLTGLDFRTKDDITDYLETQNFDSRVVRTIWKYGEPTEGVMASCQQQ